MFRFHHDIRQHQLLEDLWYNQLGDPNERTSANIRAAHAWWLQHAPRTYDSLEFPLTGNWIVAAMMYTRRQISAMLEIAERKQEEAAATMNGGRSLMIGHEPGFSNNIENELRETQEELVWYFETARQVPDTAPEPLPTDIRNLWGEETPAPEPTLVANQPNAAGPEAVPVASNAIDAVTDLLGLPRLIEPRPANLPGINLPSRPRRSHLASTGSQSRSGSAPPAPSGRNGTLNGYEPGSNDDHGGRN